MKKLLILIVTVCMACTMDAQKITRPVTLRTTELGNQRLIVTDSVYTLILKSSVKDIAIVLGGREQALKILRFLHTAEVSKGDIIELENEAGDVARFNGLKQYEFFSPGRQYTGQMAKRYVKGYIEAIEKYGKPKGETE